jgi:hypothetical protein
MTQTSLLNGKATEKFLFMNKHMLTLAPVEVRPLPYLDSLDANFYEFHLDY